MKSFKAILPEYPRTRHIPWKPNTARGDLVASDAEAGIILSSEFVSVEEKIDGANCGMTLYEGEPLIRNHTHILRKGYFKDTPAKMQFSSIFNWFYKNKELFENLEKQAGPVAVYGEWMVAQHGLEYDLLPSLFIAFDLYDYERQLFVAPQLARPILTEAGFTLAPQLHAGPVGNYELLEALANQASPFTTCGLREGVYVKVSDDRWITARFKMVRQGFIQGGLWNEKKLKKNKVI